MNLKPKLIRLHWILSAQFGIDIKIAVLSILALPRYIRDLAQFRSKYKGTIEIVPCLQDWSQEGGATKNEYFWQDLLVARMIFDNNPEKHIDIGSRIDGFVAHVASFREVEVFDVRAVSSIIPGITFKQTDFTKPIEEMQDYCDSLSCLHALEHFGLARYGDALNPLGFDSGIQNMSRLLKKEGKFYLAVPVGIERVEFNANWVFDPRTIITSALTNSLKLFSLIAIHSTGGFTTLEIDGASLDLLASQRYALVLFVFVKV